MHLTGRIRRDQGCRLVAEKANRRLTQVYNNWQSSCTLIGQELEYRSYKWPNRESE